MEVVLPRDIDPWKLKNVLSSVELHLRKGVTNPELIAQDLQENDLGTYTKEEVVSMMRLVKEDKPIPPWSDGSKRLPLGKPPEEKGEASGEEGIPLDQALYPSKTRMPQTLDKETPQANEIPYPPLPPSSLSSDDQASEVTPPSNTRSSTKQDEAPHVSDWPSDEAILAVFKQERTPNKIWPRLRLGCPQAWKEGLYGYATNLAKEKGVWGTSKEDKKHKQNIENQVQNESALASSSIPSYPPFLQALDKETPPPSPFPWMDTKSRLVGGDVSGALSPAQIPDDPALFALWVRNGGLIKEDEPLHVESTLSIPTSPSGVSPDHIKQFKAAVDAFNKAKIPYDPAKLAESLGLMDLASVARRSDLNALVREASMGGGTMVMPTGTAGGGGFNFADMLQGTLAQMMQIKVMMPILQQIGAMNMGTENSVDVNRKIEEAIRAVKGDPAIVALQEQIRSLADRDKERALVSPLQDQVRKLEERLQSQNIQSPELVNLKSELNRLQDQMRSDQNQIAQMKLFGDMVKNSGGDIKDIYAQFEKMRSDADKQIESMRSQERQMYLTQLNQLQTDIREFRSNSQAQGGDPIQAFSAIANIVDDRVKKMRELSSDEKSLTSVVPGMIGTALQHLSPALTKFAEAQAYRAGGPRPVPAAQGVASEQMQTGNCPKCEKFITIPVSGGVCPECGTPIQAAPTAQQMTQAQAPAAAADPNAPAIFGPKQPPPTQYT